jgi:hypothetical protein
MSLKPKYFFTLPIVGNLFCYTGYVILFLFCRLGTRLLGYKRIQLGTSVIWAPQNKVQTIFEGVECLKKCDTEMYLRLTTKQKLVFYYVQNNGGITNLFGYFFGLHDRYIKMGSEGIACFIVQSLLVSSASSSINQHRLNTRERSEFKVAARKTMEWMQQHSFQPNLINSYSKFVEKWEQSEHFR